MKSAFAMKRNEGVAKNVILFVADGMGPNTVTAARIYSKGEAGYLAFEEFPHIGVLKVNKESAALILSNNAANLPDVFSKQIRARFLQHCNSIILRRESQPKDDRSRRDGRVQQLHGFIGAKGATPEHIFLGTGCRKIHW